MSKRHHRRRDFRPHQETGSEPCRPGCINLAEWVVAAPLLEHGHLEVAVCTCCTDHLDGLVLSLSSEVEPVVAPLSALDEVKAMCIDFAEYLAEELELGRHAS